jgi:hypothetical protein
LIVGHRSTIGEKVGLVKVLVSVDVVEEVAKKAAAIEEHREAWNICCSDWYFRFKAEVETVSVAFVIEDAGSAVEEGVEQGGGTTAAVDGDLTVVYVEQLPQSSMWMLH